MVCAPPSVTVLTTNSTLIPPRPTWYRYPTVRDPDTLYKASSTHLDSYRNALIVPLIAAYPVPSQNRTQIQPEFRLPVEILDEIFSYATVPTLARLSVVSHTFQEVAARLLYRHIPSVSVSHTTLLVETLASKPYLAAHTRTCEIGDMSFVDANRKGLLPASFFEQLRSALRNMHRLTELTFLLNGPTSHVLLGAPFKLTKLTASCDFDATFASWLTEQPSLRAAIFCGTFTEGVALPTDALPSLRRVTGSPPTLACVVPGRPIREVDLCLVHPWSLNREVLQTTISAISASTAPLESLKIISHLSEPTDIVLSSLETIPAGLSSITKFALHAVSGSITDDILSGLPSILSRFTGLRSVVLFSKNRSDALHIAARSRTLAETWHARCSSLESVTLPCATYVHNRSYGWNTPRGLAELLEAREQPPQPRRGAAAASAQGDQERVLICGFNSDLGMGRNDSGASVVAVAA